MSEPKFYARLACDHHITLSVQVWQDDALFCNRCNDMQAVMTCRPIPWPGRLTPMDGGKL